MNGWDDILRGAQVELFRCSQEVEGRRYLPDRVVIGLPRKECTRFAPVLPEIARELGVALRRWARMQGYVWRGTSGPSLRLEIEDRPARRIGVEVAGPR